MHFVFEPLALCQQLSFPAIPLPKTLFLQERAKREKIEQWVPRVFCVLCHRVCHDKWDKAPRDGGSGRMGRFRLFLHFVLQRRNNRVKLTYFST